MKKRGRPARPHKLMLKLNERELRALEQYCKKYQVDNRSHWLRELMMTEIIRRFELDAPMLFSEEEMR
ncbi:MAG: hypothetical protein Q4A64_00130 [Porphyromonadaceae bacterium]|nr:hypothetical protein [Porphyromonadaceae bacterium]